MYGHQDCFPPTQRAAVFPQAEVISYRALLLRVALDNREDRRTAVTRQQGEVFNLTGGCDWYLGEIVAVHRDCDWHSEDILASIGSILACHGGIG